MNHVRSLLSGIFSHAAALGKVPFNPVREARVLSKPKLNQETKAYSLEHLENIISALVENPKARHAPRSMRYFDEEAVLTHMPILRAELVWFFK